MIAHAPHSEHALSLTEWAKQIGVSYRTAWRLVKSNRLPQGARAVKLATGTIRIISTGAEDEVDISKEPETVIYARVNPKQDRTELINQVNLCRSFCISKGWQISKTIREIAAGVSQRRKKLQRLLENPPSRLVILSPSVLSRYDAEFLVLSLARQGCTVTVLDSSTEIEGAGGALEDLIDSIALTCHRHYGQKIGSILVNSLRELVAKQPLTRC